MSAQKVWGMAFFFVALIFLSGCGGGGGDSTTSSSTSSGTGTITGQVSLPANTNAKLFDVKLPFYARLLASPAHAEAITDFTKLTVKSGSTTTNPDSNGNYSITVTVGVNIEVNVLSPSGNVILIAIVPEVKGGAVNTQNVDSATTAVAVIFKQNTSLTISQIQSSSAVTNVENAIKTALTDSTVDSISNNSTVTSAASSAATTVTSTTTTTTTTTTVSGCPTLTSDQQAQVSSYVSTARSSLFASSISESNFNAAKSAIASALAIDSCSADANLLGAAIDIGTESERIAKDVLYTPATIFPLGTYTAQKMLLSEALEPVVNTFTSPFSQSKSFGSFKTAAGDEKQKLTSDSPQPSEVQAEIEAKTLPVISGIITKLESVKTYADSNASWTFSYPKDPANPGLGNNTIDKNDVLGVLGAAKILRGFTYFGLAYNWDTPAGYWDISHDSDPNADGKSTPDEYFPPSPFGTLKSSGSTYLSTASTDVAAGLSLVRDAVNAVLNETSPTGGGLGLTSQQIADANHYKHYLDEIVSSFSGTTTSVTIPETQECWYTVTYSWGSGSSTYVKGKRIFDPTYNTGQTCEFSLTYRPQVTANINLSKIFSPVSDWRAYAPTTVRGNTTNSVGGGHSLVQSFPDSTLNGIFPDGIQKSWFDVTTAARSYYFSFTGSNITNSFCNNVQSSATFTVGSKSFTGASYCSSSYYSSYAYLHFYNASASLPTSSDVYSLNTLYGTTATLSLPGYQSVSFLVSNTGAWIWGPALTSAKLRSSLNSSSLHSLSQYALKPENIPSLWRLWL